MSETYDLQTYLSYKDTWITIKCMVNKEEAIQELKDYREVTPEFTYRLVHVTWVPQYEVIDA